MISRALISVSDKTGIVDFAQFLASRDVEILSTGGTAKLLRENDIEVTDVSDYTGSPEIFDGRVKTLHPKVHGGLLYLRDDKKHQKTAKEHDIAPIDLIVVNLYPFEETLQKEGISEAEVIEQIDIGGPSMLRSAAKNFQSVTVITDPNDYEVIQQEIQLFQGDTSLETRRLLAAKVFARTMEYDSTIASFFNPDLGVLMGNKVQQLRYGENPHQEASLYQTDGFQPSIVGAEQLQGKELSFNNILDANAALSVILEFSNDQPAATVVKHLNPCGTATAKTIEEAFDQAFAGDSTSAFGGIVALNREVTPELAQKLTEVFLEIIIAPSVSEKAQKILSKKKNLRVLAVGKLHTPEHLADIRSVLGGILIQDLDTQQITADDLKIVTKKKPSKQQQADMLFACKVCKHVKSNAIVLAKDAMTVGIGAGQMSRVDAADIAIKKAGERVEGSICASDAFFPFADSVEALAEAGVTAIIQPGGSVRDEEVIKRCDELDIVMVFTGSRAFKH